MFTSYSRIIQELYLEIQELLCKKNYVDIGNWLYCALSLAAQCIVFGPVCVCVFATGGLCPNLRPTTASARAVFASLWALFHWMLWCSHYRLHVRRVLVSNRICDTFWYSLVVLLLLYRCQDYFDSRRTVVQLLVDSGLACHCGLIGEVRFCSQFVTWVISDRYPVYTAILVQWNGSRRNEPRR